MCIVCPPTPRGGFAPGAVFEWATSLPRAAAHKKWATRRIGVVRQHLRTNHPAIFLALVLGYAVSHDLLASTVIPCLPAPRSGLLRKHACLRKRFFAKLPSIKRVGPLEKKLMLKYSTAATLAVFEPLHPDEKTLALKSIGLHLTGDEVAVDSPEVQDLSTRLLASTVFPCHALARSLAAACSAVAAGVSAGTKRLKATGRQFEQVRPEA